MSSFLFQHCSTDCEKCPCEDDDESDHCEQCQVSLHCAVCKTLSITHIKGNNWDKLYLFCSRIAHLATSAPYCATQSAHQVNTEKYSLCLYSSIFKQLLKCCMCLFQVALLMSLLGLSFSKTSHNTFTCIVHILCHYVVEFTHAMILFFRSVSSLL